MIRHPARRRAVARPRAVLYLRQSTYREESISLELQEHAGRDYCARSGYEVVGVYSDPGISGRTWNRPGVQEAIKRVEAGEAEVIVLWRWSRLSRRTADWVLADEAVKRAGGRIESATEPNDATAAGRFGRSIMVDLAAFESERIGEQWRETHSYRLRSGVPPTGGPRYGYTRDEEGRYHPDPVTGPILADMYRMYVAGWGSSQICRWLIDNGHQRDGKGWTYQTVLQVMDSGFGAGLLGRTKPKIIPPWEREYLPGVHKPVIDEATWRAYVAAREQRSAGKVRERQMWPLSGIIRCADCGGRMHGKHELKHGKRGGVYVCSRATTRPGYRSVTIAEKLVNKAVEEWLFKLAADLEARADAEARTTARAQRAEFAVRRAEQRLARASDRMTALTMKLADGTITDEAYMLAVARIEQEREEAKAAIRQAAPNPVANAAPRTLTNDIVRLWPRMTSEKKNILLRSLIDRVEVAPAAHRGSTAPRVRILPRWDS